MGRGDFGWVVGDDLFVSSMIPFSSTISLVSASDWHSIFLWLVLMIFMMFQRSFLLCIPRFDDEPWWL